jgi:hypothetical protein
MKSAIPLAAIIAASIVGGCVVGDIGDEAGNSNSACVPGAAITTRRVRRLTLDEIDATLTALHIDTSHAVLELPADTRIRNFANNADRLWVSPAFAEQYQALIEKFAGAAASNKEIVGCDPGAMGEDACAAQFIDTFVARAWRRPVTAEEKTSLTALFTTGKSGGTFTDGVELLLEGVLQSPEFLYHYELGTGEGTSLKLSSYELAEELAYLTTGGPPDEALRALAAGDTLLAADVRESEARRLLAKGGKAQMNRFVFSWLGLDKIDGTRKSSEAYPAFTPSIRAAMRAETEAFVAAALFDDGGTLKTLLTGSYTFADATLAKYYGFDTAGTTAGVFSRVSVDPKERGGILTQGSVLAAYAQEDSSGPVRRGHMIRSQLLCQDLPPPPPSLKITNPPATSTATTRERYANHSRDPVCQTCHRLMDPIGFGFESFDGSGVFRTMENGLAVDAHGSVGGTKDADGDFTGPAELGRRLAESSDVRDCLATNIYRFAAARLETQGDSCALDSLKKKYTADRPIVDVLVEWIRSDEFLLRKEESGK